MIKSLIMSAKDKRKSQSSNKYSISNKWFVTGDNKVRDQDHVTGTYEILLIGVVISTLN